jgi:glycosyltransferase involved in cell wall biosynthesis
MPRVSVIIPTYNCDRFLPEAIDSVLMQTYQDYEIIVIDDGSTDQTCQVLEAYKHKIRYFYQQNQGSAVARNLGIKQAKGEFIAFLDADDFWLLPEKLAEQVNCFEQQPSLGSVHTGWRIVDGGGKKIIDVEPWRDVPDLDLESWLMYKPQDLRKHAIYSVLKVGDRIPMIIAITLKSPDYLFKNKPKRIKHSS